MGFQVLKYKSCPCIVLFKWFFLQCSLKFCLESLESTQLHRCESRRCFSAYNCWRIISAIVSRSGIRKFTGFTREFGLGKKMFWNAILAGGSPNTSVHLLPRAFDPWPLTWPQGWSARRRARPAGLPSARRAPSRPGRRARERWSKHFKRRHIS